MFYRIDLQSGGDYAGIGLSTVPINKLDGKVVNGKTNEVGTSEDLVAALQNNMILVEDLMAV
jgi:hypothetical protein